LGHETLIPLNPALLADTANTARENARIRGPLFVEVTRLRASATCWPLQIAAPGSLDLHQLLKPILPVGLHL
jgi:hypothetical protein